MAVRRCGPRCTCPARGPLSTMRTGWISAGRPVGSHPRPGGARISVRERSPTKTSRAGWAISPSHTRSPRRSISDAASCLIVDDETDLREPNDFRSLKSTFGTAVCYSTVCNEFQDVARRIETVASESIPVIEVKDGIERLGVWKQVAASPQPFIGSAEPVAWYEKREVIERCIPWRITEARDCDSCMETEHSFVGCANLIEAESVEIELA